MDKKELKFYEAPTYEIVGMELEGFLCGSDDIQGVDNPDDLNGGNDDLFN